MVPRTHCIGVWTDASQKSRCTTGRCIFDRIEKYAPDPVTEPNLERTVRIVQ